MQTLKAQYSSMRSLLREVGSSLLFIYLFFGREKAWESGVLGIKTKVLKIQWLLHMLSLMVVSAELEQMARKKGLQITIHVTLFSRI